MHASLTPDVRNGKGLGDRSVEDLYRPKAKVSRRYLSAEQSWNTRGAAYGCFTGDPKAYSPPRTDSPPHNHPLPSEATPYLEIRVTQVLLALNLSPPFISTLIYG